MKLKEMIEVNDRIDSYMGIDRGWHIHHIRVYRDLINGRISKHKQKQFAKHHNVTILEMLMGLYVNKLKDSLRDVQTYAIMLGNRNFVNALSETTNDGLSIARDLRGYINDYVKDSIFIRELQDDITNQMLEGNALNIVRNALIKIEGVKEDFDLIIDNAIDTIDADKLQTEFANCDRTVAISDLPRPFFATVDRILKVVGKMPCDTGKFDYPLTEIVATMRAADASCDEKIQAWKTIFRCLLEQDVDCERIGKHLNKEEQNILENVYDVVKPKLNAQEYRELLEELKKEDLDFSELQAIIKDLQHIEDSEYFKPYDIGIEETLYYIQLQGIVAEVEGFAQDTYKINQLSENLLSEPIVYDEIVRIIYDKVAKRVYENCAKNNYNLSKTESNIVIAQLAKKKVKEFYQRVHEVNPDFQPATCGEDLIEEVNEI